MGDQESYFLLSSSSLLRNSIPFYRKTLMDFKTFEVCGFEEEDLEPEQ